MEAARLQLEEYSAQLAQVGEALELDPSNDALQELLTEIAQGIEATEALIGTLQGRGDEIGSKTNEKDSASDYSDIELDDRSISDSDDSSDEDDDRDGWGAKESKLIVSKTHYVGITSADAAGAWLKRTEMKVDESVGDTDRIVVPPSAQASGNFGDWERFTRGVGSKLLTRMGYLQGRGLGSKGDGIVAPLSAGVAPRGTHGLGFDKSKKKRRRGGKRGRASKTTAGGVSGGGGSKAQKREEPTPTDTFDFLNKTLNREKSAPAASHNDALKAKSEGELRQQVFSDHEKKLALDRQVARLEASLERNKKDASLTAIIKTQLAAVRQQAVATTQRQASAGAKLREEEERKKGFKF